jgi:hypothetical protein
MSLSLRSRVSGEFSDSFQQRAAAVGEQQQHPEPAQQQDINHQFSEQLDALQLARQKQLVDPGGSSS